MVIPGVRSTLRGPHAASIREAALRSFANGGGALTSQPVPSPRASSRECDSPQRHQDETVNRSEAERLKSEIEELRQTVAELQRVLAEKDQQVEASWADRQKEFDSLLEEKSEVIRSLHQKLQEHHGRPAAMTPREDELLALSEELERERQQMKEDEETLQKQMREMEIQMSRERAELARQRHDLQRLQSDIERELELAARDATLRERLMPFSRRHQDILTRKGAPPSPSPASPTPVDTPAPSPAADPGGKKDSGFLRRLFGQG